MITNYSENNNLRLVGKVTNEKTFSHEVYGETFYRFTMEVARLSGTSDLIPITISERLLTTFDLSIGRKVVVYGQFRSYNTYENDRSRLVLTVFAKEILYYEEAGIEEIKEGQPKVSNEVSLIGYLCKPPVYRETPFGREITDILLAVNRAYNKSDYIPCISWGRNARFCKNMKPGEEVKVSGRVQSRPYEKKYEDGTVETRMAYEVSVGSLELVDKEKKEEATKKEETETSGENQEAI